MNLNIKQWRDNISGLMIIGLVVAGTLYIKNEPVRSLVYFTFAMFMVLLQIKEKLDK